MSDTFKLAPPIDRNLFKIHEFIGKHQWTDEIATSNGSAMVQCKCGHLAWRDPHRTEEILCGWETVDLSNLKLKYPSGIYYTMIAIQNHFEVIKEIKDEHRSDEDARVSKQT